VLLEKMRMIRVTSSRIASNHSNRIVAAFGRRGARNWIGLAADGRLDRYRKG
jgi:hypothetical protein